MKKISMQIIIDKIVVQQIKIDEKHDSISLSVIVKAWIIYFTKSKYLIYHMSKEFQTLIHMQRRLFILV